MRALAVLICLTGLAGAAAPAESLDEVLARMDREAAALRKLTARFTKTNFIAVLNDTSYESGLIWIRKSGKKVEMRGEVTGEDARAFGFRDNKAEIYYPKINTVQIYDLGKQRALVDQFLLLGFGSSGTEIARNYTIKVAGQETIGGRKTTRLELIPKSQATLEQIRRVYLWIPEDRGHPVQQQFVQPSGDYYKIVYSDIRINPDLPDSDFTLKLPPGVKKDYPQK
ncbi:MAG: LolA family protein [Rhodospirillales bacterium]